MIAWIALAAALAQGGPTDQALVYFNARMALREGQPLEAVKLWFLRNGLEASTGRVSAWDDDFRSVTWAALGELGLCQDGHPADEDGAGLWPLALHNWVVANLGRRPKVKRPRAFDAFEVGRQQRRVSITDVLDLDELRALRLSRGGCLRARLELYAAGESVVADLADRQVSARLLQHLLERSRDTLAVDRVRGWAVVEARLFDLDLQRAALAAREARQDARDRARRGRGVGLSSESVAALVDEAPSTTLDPASEPARILRECAGWPVSEWMTLSAERRRFLFDRARAEGGDPAAFEAVARGVLDALVERGEGEEAEAWIARLSDRAAVWSGDRGRRLLGLDAASGFRERAVIALHRGVSHLEGGERAEAIRALAYALSESRTSREPEVLQQLARRWLSYVASRFEITDELLVTLEELVPRLDYGRILEDLLWRSAFHADLASFERGARHQVGRGALERRVELLRPLAAGDLRRFGAGLRDAFAASPSEALRFAEQLVQRLELEDAEVRAAHLPTLDAMRPLIASLGTDDPASGRHARQAAALEERVAAMRQGLGAGGGDASDQARALDPDGAVYAGSVRLVPADPIPWPFHAEESAAPSAFTPITLTPEEWRGADGETIFGWRISG